MIVSRYTLRLADGAALQIRAEDAYSAEFLDRFALAAGFVRTAGGRPPCSILVRAARDPREIPGYGECLLASIRGPSAFFCHAVGLTMAVGRIVQRRGGVVLHAALAEYRGRGVLLAAPGGTGKTTASARLPKPWRALCDDTTVIVRDERDKFWAHPWPTLSRFLEGGPGGRWDASRAVPLAAGYFLIQSPYEKVSPVGSGEGLSLLVESCEQASRIMDRGRSPEEKRALRRERFDNLAALARRVPVRLLRLSLTGSFWTEIEKTLPL